MSLSKRVRLSQKGKCQAAAHAPSQRTKRKSAGWIRSGRGSRTFSSRSVVTLGAKKRKRQFRNISKEGEKQESSGRGSSRIIPIQ